MRWTSLLSAEILEEFAQARRFADSARRTRRELAFDPREEEAFRVEGRRAWERERARADHAKSQARQIRVSKAMRIERSAEVAGLLASMARPGVSRASCVRCRREVEIREGCARPAFHPCAAKR